MTTAIPYWLRQPADQFACPASGTLHYTHAGSFFSCHACGAEFHPPEVAPGTLGFVLPVHAAFGQTRARRWAELPVSHR